MNGDGRLRPRPRVVRKKDALWQSREESLFDGSAFWGVRQCSGAGSTATASLVLVGQHDTICRVTVIFYFGVRSLYQYSVTLGT
jgi:hypothetical protein